MSKHVEPNYTEDMRLPAGKVCGDCYASRFCIGIGCTKAESTSCDYWPNRFKEPAPPISKEGTGGTREGGERTP